MYLIKHCAKKIYKRRLYILGNNTAGKVNVPAVLPLGKEPLVQIVIILTGLSYSVPQYKERERERVQAIAVSHKNYVSNLGMYVGYKQLELFIIYTFACRASTCFLKHTVVPLCHLIFLYAV
jgi:hypothetical protein